MTDRRRMSGLARIMRLLFGTFVIIGLATGSASAIIQGRGVGVEAEGEKPIDASQHASQLNGPPVIALGAAAQRQTGIATVTLQNIPYQKQVRAYGIVLDPQQLTDLSNNYANAKAQVRTAEAKLNVSQAAFARAEQLFKDQKDISAAQFQLAEGTLRVDEAARAMAESQLVTVAASARQAWGPVLGQALIDNSPMVVRLIERKEFLLQVTLPLGESLSSPPTIAFVQSNSGQRHKIQFLSSATKTDPRIQGVSFFFIAPAANDILSGMNIRAFLPSGLPVEGVVVPKAAVVWWHGRAWVYVRTAPEKFTRREIATDSSTGTGYFQSKEFSAGDEVVVTGAQMLLSEEFRPQPQPGGTKAGGSDDDD